MAVLVDSSRLQRRLKDLATVVRIAPTMVLPQLAGETIEKIQNSVRSEWMDNNQVGFDLENFINIIQQAELLPNGGIGILNIQKMGTAADFEAIRGVPGLWHQGTGQGQRFGAFINQMWMFFDHVAQLIDSRKLRWGSTEPQWWLIEYGTIGSPGAYDPRPPTMTITRATLDMVPRVRTIVENSVSRMLRERGITT